MWKINKKNTQGLIKNRENLAMVIIIVVLVCIMLAISQVSNNPNKPYTTKSPEIKKAAQKIATKCASDNKQVCYESSFKSLATDHNFSFAEQTLYELWNLDETTQRCHVLAHIISKEATRQNPEKWKEYFETANYSTCATGFLHGIMEAHIGDDPNFELSSSTINDLCFKGDFYKKNNCVHFTGHLFMIQYEGDIERALDGCEGINEGLYRRCYTGVFMEDSFPLALVEHQIRPKLPNRHSLEFIKKQEERCLRYNGERAVACSIDMGGNFEVFYNNPQKVYTACFKAPTRKQGTECFLKSAGLFAIQPEYSTPDKLVNICKSAKDKNLYRQCTERIISSLLYYSPKFLERGKILCSNIESEFKDGCYIHLVKILKNILKSNGQI